jgi:uncharacterized membrane protein
MLKKMSIAFAILMTLGLVAMIVQTVSHRLWEKRVWSCYEALGSGNARLKERFVVPPVCRPAQIAIAELGTPNAEVLFAFRPPRTMWLSYVLGSVDYDGYVIELRRRDGYVSARMHHGSD